MAVSAGSETDLSALRGENRRLQRAVQELSILNDLARTIGASLDSREVMDAIVNRSLRAVGGEQGTVTLLDDASPRPQTLVRAEATSTGRAPFHLTGALVGWMQLNARPLVLNDPRRDERFGSVVQWHPEIRSLLAVPLLVKSALRGILTVYNKRGGGGFDGDDARLLAIIAAQSAQVIENARLYEEERQLASVRGQMRLAAEVQRHLLPAALPSVDGYGIAAASIAAQEVGGDYYDVVPMAGDRFAVCLGDVSGKGLPASLLMANVQATIRLLAMTGCRAAESMAQANALLVRSTAPEKFVSFFHSVLDRRAHTLEFCNAGHNPPLHWTATACDELKTGDVVLGLLAGRPYQARTVALAPGDIVVIYSDGVTEALNDGDEEFGEARLRQVVAAHLRDSAAAIEEAVLAAVAAHAAGRAQYDDITVLVLKRDGPGVALTPAAG